MMRENAIPKRYADAFIEDAKISIGQEQAFGELANLKSVIRENPDLEKFLYNADISFKEKCGFIDKVLKDGFSEELRNFLKLLIDKGRIGHIKAICEYSRVTYAHGEVVDALLKSSYPLDLDVVQRIKEKLENKLKKKLKLYIELDARLLGGVQVVVGNTVIDGSVRKRLEDLKKRMQLAEVG